MKTSIILIDFENVQPKDLTSLRGRPFKTKVFCGANQTKIPFDLAAELQPLGPDAEYVRIQGTGRNALDFHIAYYIGRLAAESADSFFHIISRDTGFDPLIKHLKEQKILCRRSSAVDEIPLVKMQATTGQIEVCIEKLSKGARPRTERTLASSIKVLFAGQPCEEQIATIIKELQKRKVIEITDGKISYNLPS